VKRLCVAALIFWCQTIWAAVPMTFSARLAQGTAKASYDITYGPYVLFRISEADSVEKLHQRAEAIALNLTHMQAQGLDPKNIHLERRNTSYIATIERKPLFTVYESEAKNNYHQGAENVFQIWCRQIKFAFTLKERDPYLEKMLFPTLGFVGPLWFSPAIDGPTYRAIHPNLKVGTQLRLENTQLHWTVVVTVVENGPVPDGMILSVEDTAVRAMGFDSVTPAHVRIEEVL